MDDSLDFTRIIPTESMRGDSARDTALLQQMLAEARDYVNSFEWCPPIVGTYFGGGVGGIMAVFLFRFGEKVTDIDQWLWVIVGDLPSAYFVIDGLPDPVTATRTYCDLMQDWVDAVRGGSSLDDVFPVAAEPTTEHAEMLQTRLEFVRREIIPVFEADARE